MLLGVLLEGTQGVAGGVAGGDAGGTLGVVGAVLGLLLGYNGGSLGWVLDPLCSLLGLLTLSFDHSQG